MKNRLAALIALMVVATACHDETLPTQASPALKKDADTPSARAPSGIPGEYIVVFNREVTDPQGKAQSLASVYGATIRFTYANSIKGFAARMSAASATALAQNTDVAYIEQDQDITSSGGQQPTVVVGDPWGLDRIDQVRLPLDGSYHYALNGSGVTAYIVYSGILATHSEFGSRVVGGFTAINDGNGTSDCWGYGTHLAGTVGGSTYGVAKAVKLVPVRVIDCSGHGRVSGVIAGVEWVTVNHQAVGTPGVAAMTNMGVESVAMEQSVEGSIAAGVAYAINAGYGNSSNPLVAQDACKNSLARIPEAMTTGSTDQTDTKPSAANYGDCIDWFAPGYAILSSFSTSNNAIGLAGMAYPHTAGVAALYLQAFPYATPQQVRDGLYGATTKSIVRTTNGYTANNHLLYSPPGGFSGSLPTLVTTTLAVTTSKTNKGWTATLTWQGFPVATVDIYQNGVRIATGYSGSSYKDSGRTSGRFAYRVCQAKSAGNCTNTVTVRP